MFSDFFPNMLLFTKSSKTVVSSPSGIIFFPDPIIFSIRVEPHLGTPIIKMGFI